LNSLSGVINALFQILLPLFAVNGNPEMTSFSAILAPNYCALEKMALCCFFVMESWYYSTTIDAVVYSAMNVKLK
jgi:hypothetical protein